MMNKFLKKVRNKIVNNYDKKIYIKKSNIDSNRIPVSELIEKLKEYDVVSFDIFDTLIFRNVLNPTDIFQILENNNSINNFSNMRIEAEQLARQNTKKKNFEVNICDIYEEINKMLNIDVKKLIKEEFELEKAMCYANPYMLELFNKLKKEKKKIIIVSDMYWNKEYLTELLENCGYSGYYDLFVSCDIELNKGTGEIQKYISKKINTENIIHIGDNYNSDIEGSNKANWDTYYYKKCKDVAVENGELLYDDSLLSSVYSSIIVNNVYSGYNNWNKYFTYGFCYGGILTCGLLDYVDVQMKMKKIDKILFMARDSKVLYDVYNKYYNNYKNDYFVVSRSAMLEISFEKNIKSFIDFYFKMRANIAKYTIEDSLVQTDLKILLPKVRDYNLSLNDILTNDNFKMIEEMIYDNKNEIIEYFNSSKKYALDYIKNTIGDSKSVLCVDLGWGGTINTLLRSFINDNINNKIDIYGVFIGNNDNFKVNSLIDKGIFSNYCFGYNNKHNSLDFQTLEGTAKAMLLEAMFTSKEPTLLKYDKKFLYGNKTNNEKILDEIHKGIIKFVDIYKAINIPNHNNIIINNEVAFRPVFEILNNHEYNYDIFKDFQEYKDSLPRFNGDRELTTLGEILKERGII